MRDNTQKCEGGVVELEVTLDIVFSSFFCVCYMNIKLAAVYYTCFCVNLTITPNIHAESHARYFKSSMSIF